MNDRRWQWSIVSGQRLPNKWLTKKDAFKRKSMKNRYLPGSINAEFKTLITNHDIDFLWLMAFLMCYFWCYFVNFSFFFCISIIFLIFQTLIASPSSELDSFRRDANHRSAVVHWPNETLSSGRKGPRSQKFDARSADDWAVASRSRRPLRCKARPLYGWRTAPRLR